MATDAEIEKLAEYMYMKLARPAYMRALPSNTTGGVPTWDDYNKPQKDAFRAIARWHLKRMEKANARNG